MILDTDVLVDLDRKLPAARSWLASLPSVPPICGFSALELQQGCINKAEMRKVGTFLGLFPVVWPTETDMQRVLMEFAPLRLSHNLGLLDSLIAATALGLGEPVATFNRKHFHAVPGLVTIQPYVR